MLLINIYAVIFWYFCYCSFRKFRSTSN